MYPKLCQLAYITLMQWGPDHPHTLRAVYRVTESQYQRGQAVPQFYTWLLPRAVEHWGIGHPDTVRLVKHTATHLCMCADARPLKALTQIVTELAQQIPGGLGWGSAVVAPVPDEESYLRHVVMQAKGCDALSAGHYKLAKDMYQRCATYYETLGPHWLATPRKIACKQALAECACGLDGLAACEEMLLDTKRTALRELGPTNPATLDITW